jgi:hypothetical protein
MIGESVRFCAHAEAKPPSCGWKVTVYVSVARKRALLCAYGLLAEHSSRVLMRTENLAAVVKTRSHRDVKTATSRAGGCACSTLDYTATDI